MSSLTTTPVASRLTPLRWLSVPLVFTLAFLAAFLLQGALQRLGWPTADPVAATAPAVDVPSPAAWAAALPAPEVLSATLTHAADLPSTAPLPARWRTTLWMGGRAYPLRSGGIALPSGASFQVELAGLPAGTLRAYAINARGERSGAPVWVASVPAHGQVRSPALRLQGLRGLETLRVEHRDAHGRLRSQPVQLWHL